MAAFSNLICPEFSNLINARSLLQKLVIWNMLLKFQTTFECYLGCRRIHLKFLVYPKKKRGPNHRYKMSTTSVKGKAGHGFTGPEHKTNITLWIMSIIEATEQNVTI